MLRQKTPIIIPSKLLEPQITITYEFHLTYLGFIIYFKICQWKIHHLTIQKFGSSDRKLTVIDIYIEGTWPYLNYVRLSPSLFPIHSYSLQYGSSSSTSLYNVFD